MRRVHGDVIAFVGETVFVMVYDLDSVYNVFCFFLCVQATAVKAWKLSRSEGEEHGLRRDAYSSRVCSG